MKRLINLTQKVPPELNERLEAIARKEDKSKAAVVRTAINQYLDNHK